MVIAGPDVVPRYRSSKTSFHWSTSTRRSWIWPACSAQTGSLVKALCPSYVGVPEPRRDWVLSQYHSNFANTGIFMLRHGPWKYIAYPGYAPQLFHVDQDPDETVNLVSERSDIAGAMDEKLRDIVDYEAVDARAKAYDRASFRAWMDQLGRQKCLDALAGL